MKKTINRSEVMKKAWQLFKAAANRSMRFSDALRSAWKIAKEAAVKVAVKFYDQNPRVSASVMEAYEKELVGASAKVQGESVQGSDVLDLALALTIQPNSDHQMMRVLDHASRAKHIGTFALCAKNWPASNRVETILRSKFNSEQELKDAYLAALSQASKIAKKEVLAGNKYFGTTNKRIYILEVQVRAIEAILN